MAIKYLAGVFGPQTYWLALTQSVTRSSVCSQSSIEIDLTALCKQNCVAEGWVWLGYGSMGATCCACFAFLKKAKQNVLLMFSKA